MESPIISTLPSTFRNKRIINGEETQPYQNIYEQSATQQYELGTLLMYNDRKFRYSLAGATALSKAYMTCGMTNEAKLVEELQSTSYAYGAVGAYEIIVDITTASSFPENALKGGFMVVNKSNGIGDIYKIRANKVLSTDTLMRVLLETPIRTAFGSGTEVTFVTSKFYKTVVVPTTATQPATGIPLIDVTAAYYYWGQTGGEAPCYVDTGDTIVLGEPAGYPSTPAVAGACGITAATDEVWGVVRYVATAGEVCILDLKID